MQTQKSHYKSKLQEQQTIVESVKRTASPSSRTTDHRGELKAHYKSKLERLQDKLSRLGEVTGTREFLRLTAPVANSCRNSAKGRPSRSNAFSGRYGAFEWMAQLVATHRRIFRRRRGHRCLCNLCCPSNWIIGRRLRVRAPCGEGRRAAAKHRGQSLERPSSRGHLHNSWTLTRSRHCLESRVRGRRRTASHEPATQTSEAAGSELVSTLPPGYARREGSFALRRSSQSRPMGSRSRVIAGMEKLLQSPDAPRYVMVAVGAAHATTSLRG